MDIVPGDVEYTGVTQLVRSRRRRRLDHRFANVIRAIKHATGPGEETAAAVMPGEGRESRARRSKARTARGARIGRCLARGKDKAGNQYGDPTRPNERWINADREARRKAKLLAG